MGVIRLFCGVACAATALLGPAARAGVVEFNFNKDPHGWTSPAGSWEWSAQASNEKSWKLFVTGSNPSANYLTSPCFTIDDTTVGFDFNEHRFNLGFSGTNGTFPYVPPAGQVQYSINGGGWSGVPLANWSSQGADVLPTLDPAAFSSGSTDLLTNGFAFQGMSLNYAAGTMIKSSFELTGLTVGGTIRFRMLGDLGYTALVPDALNPIWDVDNVQIKGVEPCLIPEPGAICLAAGAALMGISGLARRRRRPRHRPRAAGFAKALGVAVLAAAVTSPAAAVPVVIDNEYDFANGPLGWTSQTVNYLNAPWFVPNQWTHSATGGFWQVDPVSVINKDYWVGNYLTSPVIEVAATIDILEFNMIHRFNFPQNMTTGAPVVAGQLVYKIFDAANPNAPYQPFTADVFATGPVGPPFDALTPYPDWVVPTWLAPASLPPLIAGGMSWVGESPGYASGQWIASRATLTNLFAGQFVEFRLINANLGRECTGGGWDVSYVRVNGFAPEPDGATLAAGGSVLSAAAYLVRRHRRRRISTELPGRL